MVIYAVIWMFLRSAGHYAAAAATSDEVSLLLLVVQETLEGLQSAEPMAEKLKGQLNDLVRYSRDLGSQSERVTALIKQHNR